MVDSKCSSTGSNRDFSLCSCVITSKWAVLVTSKLPHVILNAGCCLWSLLIWGAACLQLFLRKRTSSPFNQLWNRGSMPSLLCPHLSGTASSLCRIAHSNGTRNPLNPAFFPGPVAGAPVESMFWILGMIFTYLLNFYTTHLAEVTLWRLQSFNKIPYKTLKQ